MQILLGGLLVLAAIRASRQFTVIPTDGLTVRTRRELLRDEGDDSSVSSPTGALASDTSEVVAGSGKNDQSVASAGGSDLENDDNDVDVDVDEGAGDGSGLEEDEINEPTSVNENGAVNYESPNKIPVDIAESAKEGELEAEVMANIVNGMDLDEIEGDDDDDDDNDDEDSDVDEDDNGTKDEADTPEKAANGDRDGDKIPEINLSVGSDSEDIADSPSDSGDAPEAVVSQSESRDTPDSQSAPEVNSDSQSDAEETSDTKFDTGDIPEGVIAQSDSGDNSDSQSDSGDTSDSQSDTGDIPEGAIAQSDTGDNSDSQSDSGDDADSQSDTGDIPEGVVSQSDSVDNSDSQSDSGDDADSQSDLGDIPEGVVAQSDSVDNSDSQSDSVDNPDSQSDTGDTPEGVVAQSDSVDNSDSQSDSGDDADSQSDLGDIPEGVVAESDSEDNSDIQSDPEASSDIRSDPEASSESQSDTEDRPGAVVAQSDSDDAPSSKTESGDISKSESNTGDNSESQSESGANTSEDINASSYSDSLSDSEKSADESDDNAPLLRRKRLALANPNERWPKGIFPYKFRKGLSEHIKQEALAAMGYLSRHTCMEFVPYDGPKTNTDLGLGHPGYIIFDNNGGCSSYVGLWRRPEGQTISCVTRTLFIHEIGHTAFMIHEQNGANRKGLIRINYENIADKWKGQFRTIPAKYTLSYTGYDMTSLTHYPINMGSKNGRPSMSVLYEAPEFRVGGFLYYMMAEINMGYHCTAKDCPELENKCHMDSYAVKRDGACECVCTGGLDPSTGCAQPKAAARKVEDWGPGKMAMFKPKSGCPDGLTEGVLNHEGDASGSKSEFFPLDGSVGKKTSLPTCIFDGGTGKWPQGRYCFLLAGDSCPEGFGNGVFKLGKKDGGINELRFCCKNDGYDYESIQMKNEAPFTLFVKHRRCQAIEDMYAYSGWLLLDGTSISREGALPVNNIIWRQNAVKLQYCYYVPLNYGCGAAIELTDENPSAEITTPNYPDNYPSSTSCTWIVTTPGKDSVIVLDFDDSTFCLEEGDHVDVHHSKVGQPGTRVRGKGYKPSVVTLYNKLKIKFMSDLETECSGFKAKLRIVKKEDQSYLVKDGGASYRGSVNFTHSKQPCVPWSLMTSCHHHPVAMGDENDGLESNYCRNPGGGFAPWCYVYKENCERNYCDVSRIGRDVDNYQDCAEIVAGNPDFCKSENEAVRGCFKTCQESIKYDKTPKKAGEVTCSKPNALPDSEMVDVKDNYKLGEIVLYECSSGAGELERVCTSTGEWTPAAYVCGACRKGWQRFNEACYTYVGSPKTFLNARIHCRRLKATLTSIKSQEESDFVDRLAGSGVTQWLGMQATYGGGRKRYLWIDDSTDVMAGYTNWIKTPNLRKKKRKRNAVFLGNTQMKWNIVRDKRIKPWFAFTCKKLAGTPPCMDMLQNCQVTARDVPDACHRYQQWAENMCRKTCGLCGNPPACDIPQPVAGSKAVTVTKGSTVKAGHTIRYKCADGHTVSTGKLSLTCLGSGGLTDSLPVCVAKSSTVRLSNDNDLHSRSSVFGNSYTYTGTGEQYAIDAGGKVLGWMFYAKRPGTSVFQVWRGTGQDQTRLKFIGQNEVTVAAIRLHSVSVPVSEQITVETGDILGIWNPRGSAGIPYNKYLIEGQHGLRLARRIGNKDEFVPGNEYQFVEENPVKTISFKAILGPL